jgi:mannose-6-phosphate isomerase-like protein (cupin superfamily)
VTGFTHINLADVDDAAIPNGFADRWEAHVARTALDAKETGVSHFRIHPGRRSPFAHRHSEAEEIYVILGGSGRMRLGTETRDVGRLDAIRVAPDVVRAFEAGSDGLEILVFGRHHAADGELVKDGWVDGSG